MDLAPEENGARCSASQSRCRHGTADADACDSPYGALTLHAVVLSTARPLRLSPFLPDALNEPFDRESLEDVRQRRTGPAGRLARHTRRHVRPPRAQRSREVDA